jgi:hypothetical protein
MDENRTFHILFLFPKESRMASHHIVCCGIHTIAIAIVSFIEIYVKGLHRFLDCQSGVSGTLLSLTARAWNLLEAFIHRKR